MAQWVNDPVLSLLWLGFDLWPGNLCMPQVRAKNKHTLIINKKKKSKKKQESDDFSTYFSSSSCECANVQLAPRGHPPLCFMSRHMYVLYLLCCGG